MASKKKKATTERNQSKQPINKYPPLIQQLIKKHEGNMLSASRAVGRITGYWLNKYATGTPFDDAAKAIVEKALAGEKIAQQESRGGETAHRNAIVIVKGDQFEKLYDIATMMGGEWKLKKKAGGFWIGVVSMQGRELTAFLALATAKGVESYAT